MYFKRWGKGLLSRNPIRILRNVAFSEHAMNTPSNSRVERGVTVLRNFWVAENYSCLFKIVRVDGKPSVTNNRVELFPQFLVGRYV